MQSFDSIYILVAILFYRISLVFFALTQFINYPTVTSKELSDEIGGVFVTGDFKRILVAQLQGNREEDVEIDEEKVKKDAQDLYDVSSNCVASYTMGLFVQ